MPLFANIWRTKGAHAPPGTRLGAVAPPPPQTLALEEGVTCEGYFVGAQSLDRREMSVIFRKCGETKKIDNILKMLMSLFIFSTNDTEKKLKVHMAFR